MTSLFTAETVHTEKLLALKRLPGASDVPLREVALLAAVARTRTVAAGHEVQKRGAPSTIKIVLAGKVDAEGAIFGALETLAGGTAIEDVRALSEVSFLEIERDDLFEVLEDSFVLLLASLSEISRSLIDFRVPYGALYEPHSEMCDVRDPAHRIMALIGSGLLSKSRIQALAELIAEAKLVEAKAGQVLWSERQYADRITVLLGGRVSIDGKPLKYAVSGLLELLSAQTHHTTAVAESDAVFLSIDREAFIDLLEDRADAAIELLSALSRKLLEGLSAGQHADHSRPAAVATLDR